MSIEEKVEDYKKTLAMFPNPQEKYQYLIEQAKKNEDFPQELRIDEFKVNGCQSQVWLVPEEKKDEILRPPCHPDFVKSGHAGRSLCQVHPMRGHLSCW